mgnify:CR=1 FL=1
MLRISLSWLAESFAAIERLSDVSADLSGVQAWSPIHEAKTKLDALFEYSVYKPHLRISPERAQELTRTLQALLDKVLADEHYKLTEIDAWQARHAGEQFKVVFLSELGSLPTFLVLPKENYDVNRLIENGIGLFPSQMPQKVPEATDDAMEAGRCLAYECNTASGFHTFRVVEAVTRRYWDAVAEGRARPHPETIGRIAGELETQVFGEPKIHESLKQLAKLHRNPIAHPEVILTSDEAIAIVGMARSVITPMLQVLPVLLPTTTNQSN